MKTKGEPKAGAGFLTNYQLKSGANHICYKNATQSRGNLYCIIRETFTIIIVAESSIHCVFHWNKSAGFQLIIEIIYGFIYGYF